MKAFHFTLEAVRTVRQRQEQKALELYSQALLFRQQAFERLDTVQRELNAGFAELRTRMAEGCAASQIAQANDYHRSLTRRRDECILALGTAERRVNAAMQTMLAARQQREVVDNFFDKQKLRHDKDVLVAEQKFLDDLAGRRVNSVLAWNQTESPA